MPMRLSGLASGMDTENIVSELMKAHRLKSTKIENRITKIEWTQDKWKSLNSKIYSLYTGPLAKLKMQGSYNSKNVTSSDESKATITANGTAPGGTHSLQIKQLASAQYETGNQLNLDKNAQAITTSTKLTDLNMVAGTGNQILIDAGNGVTTFTVSETSTVDDFIKSLKSAGLNASYDTTQKRFYISSKESGNENAFSITTAGTVDLSKLGLSTINKTDNGDGSFTVSGGVNVVAPKDAKIVYNGVEMTSSSNVVSANGLSITLKGVTTGADTVDTSDDVNVNINVTDNTKAIYDMIKGFVKNYNELVKEMNDSFYATSAGSYEPLTDEQKDTMTDEQIEKWEKKIKDSLLRRDDTLSSLMTTIRNNLSGTVDVSGKKYGLSTFGIASANYSENGLLHIDGDVDDSLVAAKENDLMKALSENPDTVMTVITELAGKLYDDLADKMSSTTLRSALTFYNDKDMVKSITKYKSDLDKMEAKLSKMEERYYKQFAAMETAMAKMNSQSSNLASMLGSN